MSADRSTVERRRVLFLCIGNACRSPMGEAILRARAPERFEACSAGLAPIGVQPETLEVLREIDIDTAGLDSTSIYDEVRSPPDLIISLSREATLEAPRMPMSVSWLEWHVADPFGARGSTSRRLAAFRKTRDAIVTRIDAWLARGAPYDP